MRMRRILAAIALFILLSPNPLAVPQTPKPNRSQIIWAKPVSLFPGQPERRTLGALTLIEGWALNSDNTQFGAWSSLALLGDRRFLMGGDNGVMTGFTLGPRGDVTRPFIAAIPDGPGDPKRKTSRDLEAMIYDPAAGKFWLGFENENAIWRYGQSMARAEAKGAPALMKDWPGNGGVEAMVMLPAVDGGMPRFLVIAEKAMVVRGGKKLGAAVLLFNGDPAEPGTAATRYHYDAQGWGRVTDAAVLPDGRILLLHRDFGYTSGFRSTLAIADLATLKTGVAWRAKPIAHFAPPAITENFEGLAITQEGPDTILWMVSDDNLAYYQQSLLLKFRLNVPE